MGSKKHERSLGCLHLIFREVTDAVMKPSDWPRYQVLLQEINNLCALFSSFAFET